MKLAPEQVQRFYEIWFFLLHYVNEKKNLVESFPREYKIGRVSPEMALPIRNALWEDDSLRESFIAENPDNLSAADLKLVESWQYRVKDTFFISRYLKKHTVLISHSSPSRAYGVQGLLSAFEEIAGPYLPVLVQAVLLPFEGQIIYDSLLMPYNVSFGSGYRASLADTYRNIQERSGVITSLPFHQEAAQVKVANKKVLTAFQKDLGRAGLSPAKMQEHLNVIKAFDVDFLQAQNPPVFLLDVTTHLIEDYVQSQKKKVNTVSFKRFVKFLRDTWRIEYDDAEAILKYLKN